MKLLQLNFLPRSADLGLLLLRLWFGGGMLWLHGWGKLTSYSSLAGKFPDPLGVGSGVSLGFAVFAETACAGLLVLGLFTRLAAFFGAMVMGVAFWVIHGHQLSGPQSGELALCYFVGYAALFVAGGGRLSVDAAIGAKG